MKRSIAFVVLLAFALNSFSQNQMTPELLWSLGRVSGLGVSKDKQWVLYSVSTPDINENKSKRKVFAVPKNGGEAIVINNPDSLLFNDRISPDGKYIISAVDVKLKKIEGKELYPELSKSNVQVYNELNYRHWDTWEDGAYSHVFVAPLKDGKAGEAKDIM
ncbi:MAG TPA: hypothetical protein VK173_10910, partial [Lacibacter sp.]|nr:hypothetical protein [Lacibacter sp.]